MSPSLSPRPPRWWRLRARQRGSVALVCVLSLTVIVGLVALVVDVGHVLQVRSQLQNAADSAAFSGVLDLNGSTTQFGVATASAQYDAQLNTADGSAVTVPGSDVVLGNWRFPSGPFTALSSPDYLVNAVKVTTRREAATGNAVSMYLAPVIGIWKQNVEATAIAVGGGPASIQSGFPLALPACTLYDATGNFTCSANLVFNSNNNNVALTLLSQSQPTQGPLNCMTAQAVGTPASQCPSQCVCNGTGSTSSVGDSIRIGNGNDFPTGMMTEILNAIAATPGGLFVQAPIVDTGQQTSCGSGAGALSGVHPVAGYVRLRITSATSAPTKAVHVAVDCSGTASGPPGGGLFGYRAGKVYLGQ